MLNRFESTLLCTGVFMQNIVRGSKESHLCLLITLFLFSFFFFFLFRSHAVKMSQIMITQSFSLYEYRTVLKGFTHSRWVLMERLYVLVCTLICPFYQFDKLLKIKICTLSLCTTENCLFSFLFLFFLGYRLPLPFSAVVATAEKGRGNLVVIAWSAFCIKWSQSTFEHSLYSCT